MICDCRFVKVFDQEAQQVHIYDAVAKPVVESSLKGYNGTIFAYGQTGSGKTHTISGTKDNPGVVPRALQDIFSAVEQAEGETYDVQMSYLEIYNEQSNDLLLSAGKEKKKIALRENGDKLMEWHNLSLTPIQTYTEALELLSTGDTNRIVGDTPMNVYSSRSHTILTIHLTAHVHDSLEIRRAKLNLVDLAGSERVHKTGEEGIILEEARHINLSLHYLEQVIVALSDPGRSHVPYRNCTLTSALRDSLGGNCMTVMVANIAIDKDNIEETISTCRFAQRVSLVPNELILNSEKDLSGENNQLRLEIHQLRGQCTLLRNKVKELEQRENKLFPEDCGKREYQYTENKHLYSTQLKTDIIYLIDWLQEMKGKHPNLRSVSDSSSSGYNVLCLAEPDEGFDEFAAATNAREDWSKARESEKTASDALASQINIIDAVHQEMLDWWKQDEKSLVREMMSGRVINIPGTEVKTVADDASATDISIDQLMGRHSELLKDFQLLKSRLKHAKRNLQRLKRKYLVEFTNWKKGKVPFEDFFDQLGGFGDAKVCVNDISGLSKNCSMKNQIDIDQTYLFNKDDVFANKISGHARSDFSLMLNESGLSSILDNSAFSTSTLLSDSRITSEKERLDCKEPRLVRSEPLSLHSAELGLQTGKLVSIPLTGVYDIDEEIIAFYENKHPS
ncbi:uncharacterized protein LOC128995747 [Macrosteles quadrilineatus]|uniref:uncharacterized protein LOC128995747 n=1 Tax=Macrosteles quadrilineatus TaxID=74068 RepID=UPI0023E20D76|nr:uncharacterized protein LOC128995747 [Macrosteles quadrilineatus]